MHFAAFIQSQTFQSPSPENLSGGLTICNGYGPGRRAYNELNFTLNSWITKFSTTSEICRYFVSDRGGHHEVCSRPTDRQQSWDGDSACTTADDNHSNIRDECTAVRHVVGTLVLQTPCTVTVTSCHCQSVRVCTRLAVMVCRACAVRNALEWCDVTGHGRTSTHGTTDAVVYISVYIGDSSSNNHLLGSPVLLPGSNATSVVRISSIIGGWNGFDWFIDFRACSFGFTDLLR